MSVNLRYRIACPGVPLREMRAVVGRILERCERVEAPCVELATLRASVVAAAAADGDPEIRLRGVIPGAGALAEGWSSGDVRFASFNQGLVDSHLTLILNREAPRAELCWRYQRVAGRARDELARSIASLLALCQRRGLVPVGPVAEDLAGACLRFLDAGSTGPQALSADGTVTCVVHGSFDLLDVVVRPTRTWFGDAAMLAGLWSPEEEQCFFEASVGPAALEELPPMRDADYVLRWPRADDARIEVLQAVASGEPLRVEWECSHFEELDWIGAVTLFLNYRAEGYCGDFFSSPGCAAPGEHEIEVRVATDGGCVDDDGGDRLARWIAALAGVAPGRLSRL